MPYTISALLNRNLHDVFGENDPARRRAAIDEIYTEDCVFYEPGGGVHRGRDPIDRIAGTIRATRPDFRYQPIAEPEAPPIEEEPVEAGELYNVFLSKITDTSKRDKAAELIAKVKGCSTSEAKELTTRLVIPLAKNVSKNKAEDILNQFKKLKIFGRMTKVK